MLALAIHRSVALTFAKRAKRICSSSGAEDCDNSDVVLAKAIASCGLCSRREAAEIIKQGRVLVNGLPALVQTRVDLWADSIAVDGKLLQKPSVTHLFIAHKPRGCLTTTRFAECIRHAAQHIDARR